MVDYASLYNTTPVITFDQQLGRIAFMVIEVQPTASLLHKIFLFHGTQINYLGTIVTPMAGLGQKR